MANEIDGHDTVCDSDVIKTKRRISVGTSEIITLKKINTIMMYHNALPSKTKGN